MCINDEPRTYQRQSHGETTGVWRADEILVRNVDTRRKWHCWSCTDDRNDKKRKKRTKKIKRSLVKRSEFAFFRIALINRREF